MIATKGNATLVAFATGAAMMLSACSGAAPTVTVQTGVPDPAATNDTATQATTEATTAAAPAPASGEITAAGTALKFGDPATVEVTNLGLDDGTQRISITVTGVRKGSVNDFKGVVSDADLADLAGYTPYYIDISSSVILPLTASVSYGAIYSDFGGFDSNGDKLPPLLMFGSYDKCETKSFSKDADSGQPETTCTIVVVKDGKSFGGAWYSPFDSPYDPYNGSPISWT